MCYLIDKAVEQLLFALGVLREFPRSCLFGSGWLSVMGFDGSGEMLVFVSLGHYYGGKDADR